jgi:pimeloyl-ACP methyl ester carboxylesterase
MQTVKNVVLVHGAWADGSSWSKLIPLLQAQGYQVACAHNPLSSVADDVASTNRIINAQDGPVLLVGHSYGGAVITEAGHNPKVSGLVYVAAFAPDEGETLGGMAQPVGATPGLGELRPIEDGYLLLSAKGVAEDFAQDLSAEEKNTMFATQGATQGAVLATPITRMKAKTLSLPTSHVAMLAKPKEVAEFIISAAASLGAPQLAKAS